MRSHLSTLSIRRKRASSPTPTRPPRPPAWPSPASRLPSCAQNFLPNLTQSLANSRLTLAHLYVTLIFQRIGQRGDSYRLPAARTRLRFARCPCTKPAICAGAVAVNHPHHINHVNHSSDKCQPSLVRALIPVNPFHPPPKALQRGPYSPGPRRDARGLHQPPVCPVAPKIFLTQSHTFSRNLSSSLVHLACPYAIRNTQFSAQPAPSPLQEPGPPYKLYP